MQPAQARLLFDTGEGVQLELLPGSVFATQQNGSNSRLSEVCNDRDRCDLYTMFNTGSYKQLCIAVPPLSDEAICMSLTQTEAFVVTQQHMSVAQHCM